MVYVVYIVYMAYMVCVLYMVYMVLVQCLHNACTVQAYLYNTI